MIRQVVAYLTLIYGGSLAVAVLLVSSPAAPSAVGRTTDRRSPHPDGGLGTAAIWRDLGLSRPGVAFWPVAIGVPVGMAGLVFAVVAWGAVATGFLHALVHLPLLIFTTRYNSVGSRWLVAPVMVVTITAASVLYAWLRETSGSIWPATLAHATGNTLVGMITATAASGSETTMAHLAGEGGVITCFGVSAVAVMILVRARIWRGDDRLDRPLVEARGRVES